MPPRRNALLLVAALACLPGAPSGAHELGKIQVDATFAEDGTYRIDLTADPQHLGASDLGGPAAETRYGAIGDLTPAVEARFGRFLSTMADGAIVAFDGRPVEPRALAVGTALTPRTAPHLRLEGSIPAGARTFTWREDADVGSYPITVRHEGQDLPVMRWLDSGDPSEPFALRPSVVPPPRTATVARYLKLGFTHILPKGLDHILFVLGLFLLSRRLRPLLSQVTAFTVAHTATLALSIYGVLSIPASVVEPLIALSIVFVAVENVLTSEVRASRVLLVFAFGLLHGMGFAGVLSSLGLPRAELVPALVSFNVGVEMGQLAVIGLAFLAVGTLRRRSWYRRAVVVPASCLIAAAGLYWSIERVFF
ncbi:MAG: HupE/UreJ family protein [Thermoanaerobaculia bacterium]